MAAQIENQIKNAVITSFLSKTKDRFHEYNEVRTLEERLQMVSTMEGIDGIEAVFPYETSDAEELKRMLKQYQIQLAAINVNVKAEPEFRDGGLTSINPEIRKKAVQFIKDAKDYAKSVDANKVTCCPLGDGFEFNFHCDYRQMWRNLIETLGEGASHCPEIPLFIEYKPSETRARCFVDTAAKTLCLLNDIQIKEMGITLDFGHSLYGQEHPAEVLSLLVHSGFGYYIHINDNDRKWDWDFMAGTRNLLDYIEFLFYLQEFGYDDYITSDTSPTRWDIKSTFEMNARITNKIWTRLLNIDREELKNRIAQRDFIKTWQFVENEILVL